jgi:hypothetical protein
MAFVVPAEIGHAPYAAPLLRFLAREFETVHVIALREKIFPQLSEDCWLLHCENRGSSSREIWFSVLERFQHCQSPPPISRRVSLNAWAEWNFRLRPFLLDDDTRTAYLDEAESGRAKRFGQVASVGIGYVTGANEFFHLRPSKARLLGIPDSVLAPTIRSGRDLGGTAVTEDTVAHWYRADEANFLLRLDANRDLPCSVARYLESAAGQVAREAYKCRMRRPWFVVPDVRVADGFLSYMSGHAASLVSNDARCAASNSVHLVRMRKGFSFAALKRGWSDPLTRLSCELEGHPLGGGMLKLEPSEAARILVRRGKHQTQRHDEMYVRAMMQMKRWRHYG